MPTSHREIVITPRGPGEAARFPLSAFTNSDAVSVSLNGSVYSGAWTFVPDGGSQGVTRTVIPTANGYRAVISRGNTQANTGTGRVQLRDPKSGDSVSCDFRFSFQSMTGFGECAGSNGRAYDLQVLNVAG